MKTRGIDGSGGSESYEIDADAGHHLQHPPRDRRRPPVPAGAHRRDPAPLRRPTSCCSRRSTRARRARGSSISPRSWPRRPAIRISPSGHNVSLKKGRYGNATLSRFPILRERNIDLSIAESWIRRGCQHTTLDLDGKDGRTWRCSTSTWGSRPREREPSRSSCSSARRVQRACGEHARRCWWPATSTTGARCCCRVHQRPRLLLRHRAQARAVPA